MREIQEELEGLLLGMAVGDAIGLPREQLSKERALLLFGHKPLQHGFLWGRGMISDDTEHACMVGQALLASSSPDEFARSLGWRLRGWLLGLPGGVGFATLRSILKLWVGFPPSKSGVYSAGNGPAMRAPLLGICFGHDVELLECYVRASTSMTHTDEKAYEGAMLVALATSYGAKRRGERLDVAHFFAFVREHIRGDELRDGLNVVRFHLERGSRVEEFAEEMGFQKGVSGYINHTVLACLYCWLRWQGDFREIVEQTVLLGGDADTTGAIVGGMAGATLGVGEIPDAWISGLWEYPRSVAWMRSLAGRLAAWNEEPEHLRKFRPVRLFWPAIPLRNLFFLAVVLCHGFRRLLPPYARSTKGEGGGSI